MRIAVCDDNKMCLSELNEQLLSIPLVKSVFPFSGLNAFLSSVEDGNFYDAVLMDIEWGQDGTGMDAAEEIYKLSPETKIIYVTGHSERYQQHIFLGRANLSGFLTKPVDGELLTANLQKAADSLPRAEQPSIVLRCGGDAVSVPYQEILYIESKGRTLETHTAEEVFVSYGQLEIVMRSLPKWFVRCHKSFAVNMRRIQRFQPSVILLKNGAAVPVSRSKYAKAREAHFNFIGETF